jgi:predicted transcriptional regulator
MKIEQLSEIEANLYQVLKEYITDFKEFNLKMALPYCFEKLNHKYSDTAITLSVRSLIQKKYIIQGSSLTKEDILHNQNRKKILDFIQINPGSYNRLIRRELSLGSNEFNWHVGMLEKFGFVKKVRFLQRSFGYFEKRSYMDHEYDLYLLQNEKISKILKILDKKQLKISQITKMLEFHYNTVQKYLNILEKREIILLTEIRKHIYYSINTNLMIKLKKIINGQVFISFAE